PESNQTSRASIGEVNRPFAAPADPVEIRVRRPIAGVTALALPCYSSPGLSASEQYVVTTVFTPPRGPRNAVVLANTQCGAIDSYVSACQARLGTGGTAVLKQPGATESPVQVMGLCVGGDRNGLRCCPANATDCFAPLDDRGCPGGTCREDAILAFNFPDTTATKGICVKGDDDGQPCPTSGAC